MLILYRSMLQSGQFGQLGTVQGASERLQHRERGAESDSHLSPNSAHTVVNVNFPSHPTAGAGTYTNSAEEDENLIATNARTTQASQAAKCEANGCD